VELKPGYRQTEVGVIPKDWAVTKLGKHATFKTGPFGSALHQSDYIDGGVPVINPMQIVDGRIQPTTSMAITEQAARKLSDFRLSRGDVVIGRRGDMGRCALVQPEQHGWLCGTGSMIVRAGASLDGRFIQRVLSSPPIIAAIESASVGSTMVNLNQSTLRNLLVPLPPSKAEQSAIVEALSDADALIESLEHLITKKRYLKQGAMQELLTGKGRLPGFEVKSGCKQTELGMIPEDWETRPLGDGIALSSGQHVLTRHYNTDGTGVPYLTGPADFPEEIIRYTKFTTKPGTICHSNDILVTVKGSGAGTLVIADGAYCISRQLMAIRPDTWDSLYIYYSLLRDMALFGANASGPIPGLSRGDILSKQIALPPTKAEQTAIATVLSDLDAAIAALEAKVAKARQIKLGMMQELLTGRTRLK
jgi:type I restriction enzyme, S subunit